MARVVKNTEKQVIACDIIVSFEDGSKTTKTIKVGDIVEGLRYVEDEQVKSVTGKVKYIQTVTSKVTKNSTKNPVDYFTKDVIVRTITVDCSEQYESKVVDIVAREIVEDEGVTGVVKVDVLSHPFMNIDIEYTDGTINTQELEISDVLTNVKVMTEPGQPDITGNFKIAAFYYTNPNANVDISGVYMKSLEDASCVLAMFKNFIELAEESHVDVSNPSSLADISAALAEATDGVVYASLGVDVEIPVREDGRITTTMISEGQTLNMDLNGHNITTQAYAFYVNGGTLNISNSSGEGGVISCNLAKPNTAYPAIYVFNGGVCNMDGGVIDTTAAPTSETNENWLYGVVCSGDGIFNMTGGEMKIYGAAGISITNGTATCEGAKFTIGGDSKISSITCAGVYLADNKSVVVKDNAVINNGIVARMGDITIQDNAVVNSHTDPSIVANLGAQACFSGVDAPKAAFLGLTGVYNSALGNDLNVVVKDNAKVVGNIDDAIDIAFVNTKYPQKVVVNIESEDNVEGNPWRVYSHDELAELATEAGKTLGAENGSTDLTIKLGGAVVYPVVDEEEGE